MEQNGSKAPLEGRTIWCTLSRLPYTLSNGRPSAAVADVWLYDLVGADGKWADTIADIEIGKVYQLQLTAEPNR